MVQTRRRARQRGAPLLRLPTDVLHKIATHAVLPELVVAAGTNVEARTALRKGTDEAERSRFGGIGMTVREAEHVLRTRYRNIVPNFLLDLDAAGPAFSRKNIICTDVDHPDAPEDIEDWLDDDGQEVFVASRFVRTLLAYGADPSGTSDESFTPLHLVAAYAPSDAIELARFLLAAGADIDAECNPADLSGTCALTWCITDTDEMDGGLMVSDTRCELAAFLVEQGCDVAKADAGFTQANKRNEFMEGGDDRTLLTIFAQQSTPEGERLVDLITTALEEAGPERRQAAADAARQRFNELVDPSQYHAPYIFGDGDSDDDD